MRRYVTVCVAVLVSTFVSVAPAAEPASPDTAGERVRFGIVTRMGGATWEEVREGWLEAERLGFDSVWMNDHLLGSRPSPEDAPQLEAWTTVAALATLTERIEMGVLVSGNTFRNPALLAKMVTTIDHMSDGRIVLGVGAGWARREHEAYGFEYGTARERAEKLSEALQVIGALWGDEPRTFEGKYYRVNAAPWVPANVRRPRPPIVVGGQGKKWIVPLVGRFADGWNANPPVSPDGFRERLEIIEAACAEVGRADCPTRRSKMFQMVALTRFPLAGPVIRGAARLAFGEQASSGLLVGHPDDMVETIQQYVDAGANEILIAMLAPFDPEEMRIIAEEIVPRIHPADTVR